MEYQYPIDHDWTTDEIMLVIHFFRQVEKAYENQVNRQRLLDAYQQFKQIVSSKSEEKTLFKQFEKQSGYTPYRVVQVANKSNEQRLSMK